MTSPGQLMWLYLQLEPVSVAIDATPQPKAFGVRRQTALAADLPQNRADVWNCRRLPEIVRSRCFCSISGMEHFETPAKKSVPRMRLRM